jgi:WD40 repeat protein
MLRGNLRAGTVLLLGMGLLGGGLMLARSGAQDEAAKTKPPPASPETIRELIKQLEDTSFKVREEAIKRLAAIGETALPMLRKVADDRSADPDLRLRAARAMRQIEQAGFGEVRRFEGHQGPNFRWATRIAVTADGRQAISAGFDALRHWDITSGKQIRTFGANNSGYWAVSLSGDGRRVLAGGGDRIARVFDVQTGQELRQLIGHGGAVWGAVLSADGKKAVTGAWDNSLRYWDVETGKELRAFKAVRGNVRCLALSADGKFVAAGHFIQVNGPGTIRLWDVEKGQEIRAFQGHTQEVTSVAFSADGKTLLSSSFDHTLRLWTVATGKEIKRLMGHTNRIEGAAFTPDGKRVVSCGAEQDPMVRLWDVTSGKQLFASEPVAEGFLSVAVLPDAHHALTSGKDGVLRLWHWAR